MESQVSDAEERRIGAWQRVDSPLQVIKLRTIIHERLQGDDKDPFASDTTALLSYLLKFRLVVDSSRKDRMAVVTALGGIIRYRRHFHDDEYLQSAIEFAKSTDKIMSRAVFVELTCSAIAQLRH
jgi:hypothetical protein